MHSPTIIILSVVLGFLTCTDTNTSTVPSSEEPSQVVRQYVSFAHAGEFDKAESLVISTLDGKPKNPETVAGNSSENKKETSNSKSTNGLTIVPDPRVIAEGTLDWVNDFERSIHDEKLSIRSVRKESANKTEARVEIILGNEKTVNPLGWVFLLRKVEDKWKIYDITTPGAELGPLN